MPRELARAPTTQNYRHIKGKAARSDPPTIATVATTTGLSRLLLSWPFFPALQTPVVGGTDHPGHRSRVEYLLTVDDIGCYASAFMFPMSAWAPLSEQKGVRSTKKHPRCASTPLLDKVFYLLDLLTRLIAMFLTDSLFASPAIASGHSVMAQVIRHIGNSRVLHPTLQ